MADVSFEFTGDASSLRQALDEIKGEVGKVKSSVDSLAGRFVVAFAAVKAAIASVRSAFSTLGSISEEAAKMEQTGLAFKVMMRDAATAAEYVAKLRRYAAETPFEFGDISDAAKTLLAMGTEAEKSVEVIRKLGDIASVSGKPLKDLAFLYAKVQNAGLTNEVAESLEMQGVPIRRLLAEMKGISFEEVFQGISKRQFDVSDLDAALEKLTGPGGLLENMTKLQSQTFSGALSTLTDNFSALAVELGTPLNAAILPVMQELSSYMETLIPTIQAFGQGLASAFESAVGIISPIVSGIGELVSMLGGAKTVIAAVAAGILMYVGNTRAATTSTAALKTQASGLMGVFRSFNLTSFTGMFKSAMAGIRTSMSSTLAGLKLAWSTAWTTMATVTRAAMVAVKAAIVSTGIGLIIVGIGEALGALYSWFMGNSEAAEQAAESARQFNRALKDLEKQASKVKTHDQYESFIENLESRIDDLRDQRDMAIAKDEDEEVIDLLNQQIDRLKERKRYYEETLPKQVEAAIAAERAAEALRKQNEQAEELARKIEEVSKRMADMANRQYELERNKYISQFAPETQIRLILSDAGGFKSAEALYDEIQRLSSTAYDAQLGDDVRLERLITAYNKIVELQERIQKEARDAEAEHKRLNDRIWEENHETQRQYEDFQMTMSILEAEINGHQRKLALLKEEQRVIQLTREYERKGFSDPEMQARRMVQLERQAEEKRQQRERARNIGRNRESGNRISSSTAAAGGGGRSVLIGGPMLSEAKKQTKLLGQMDTSLKRKPVIQVSGNVAAVISD